MATDLTTNLTLNLSKSYQPGATFTGTKAIAVSLPATNFSLDNDSNDIDYNERLTIASGTDSINLNDLTDIYGNSSIDMASMVTIGYDTRFANTGKVAVNTSTITLTVETSGDTNLVEIPCQPESAGVLVFPDGLSTVDAVEVAGATDGDIIDVYLTGIAT